MTDEEKEVKAKVRGLMRKFKLLVDNIDVQFDKVIGQHEDDFIAAYRVSYFILIVV